MDYNKYSLDKKKIILIILLGFLVYLPSFSVPFIWDDGILIVDNPLIQDMRFLPRLFSEGLTVGTGFYRPLQAVSNMLDFRIWGNYAAGFHSTNILLHILCAALLFILFSRLFDNERVAFLSALVFLLHPVNVETVTYISGRADSLMAVFLLLSFIKYLRSYAASLRNRALIYSTLFFICALLSKELALVGIFVFPLLDWVSGKKTEFGRYKPLLAVAALYLLVRLMLFGIPYLKNDFTLLSRLFTFLSNILEYIRILLFPVNLHMSYTSLVFIVWNLQLSLIVCSWLSIFTLLWWILRQQRRLFFFCLVWFFIFLLSQSGLIPINAFFAEHFIYVSAYALFFLLLSACFQLARGKGIVLIHALVILALAIFSFATIRYQRIWQDATKFYSRIIQLSPGSFAAYNNLGIELERQGLVKEARHYYLKAIAINPDYGLTYSNLAKSYAEAGEKDKALALFNQGMHKGYVDYYNLGKLYTSMGKLEEAANAFRRAKDASRWSDASYVELALIYRQQGKINQALEELQYALKLKPKQAQIHLDLGLIYKEQGKFQQAIDEYQVALRINPQLAQAYNNLGVLYAQLGNFSAGLNYLLQSLSLDKDYDEARFNLGLLYAQMGLYLKAQEQFENISQGASFYPAVQKQLSAIRHTAKTQRLLRKDAK
jgi:tetratricopeptide (TPR) repeat protein